MNEGHPLFYAEIGPSQSIRDSYAPSGNCRHCDAKLSIYRNNDSKSPTGYELFCSPCLLEGRHLLPQSEHKKCTNCGNSFASFGDRVFCIDCMIPSARLERSQ